MIQIEQPPTERARVADLILELGQKAFDPTLSETERAAAESAFNGLIEKTGTWSLVQSLNALIRPDNDSVPSWLRPRLMHILTLVPLRPDGVRATLEFIFSVHPSSQQGRDDKQDGAGLADSDTPTHKQGASITPEALTVATRLLSAPPRSVGPEDWFAGIGPQLFAMLDGDQGPELVKVASHVVCSGFLSKKQFGAPGAPAWRVFVEPILQAVNPSLRDGTLDGVVESEDAVVDLTADHVLTRPKDLVVALRRLMCFVLSSPYPSQCRRIIGPILLPLWTLSSWHEPTNQVKETVCVPARSLLETFLRINTSHEIIVRLARNLTSNGVDDDQALLKWRFQSTPQQEVQAVRSSRQQVPSDLDLGALAQKGQLLVEMLISSCSKEDLSSFSLSLLRRWLSVDDHKPSTQAQIRAGTEDPVESEASHLVDAVILQTLMEKAPDRFIGHFHQLLELICQVLEADSSHQQPDDVMSVTLSLLNLVITAPSFKRAQLKPPVLALLETSLGRLGRQNRDEISPTARNLDMLLRFRDDVDREQEAATPLSNRQMEDRKTYRLAMSYIAEKDSPPPVRSEGLSLISGLIQSGSPALDIPAVLVLLSSLIKDDEDYMNLRVIKVYAQLANKHPKSVVDELLDRYVDAREMLQTDTRLRFGEALLQVIERLGETFTGDLAKRTGEALLSIAGRRGYRPKTKAKQERAERARATKHKEAQDAWGGEVLDLADDDMPEEERAREEILRQIVEGWGSKRGSEDVRVRSSALSVFATALETNLVGIGPSLVSAAVDLCINVLTLEPEPEKAILRRASAILTLGFVRGLDRARQEGRRLGFGLTDASREDMVRTLRYVAATDGDGLVREQAADVAESLENWSLARLLPVRDEQPPVLAGLAGLGGGPGGGPLGSVTLGGASSLDRPLIEEVE